MSRSFGNEASVTVAAIGADGVAGAGRARRASSSSAVLPADTLVRVAAAPNVTGAAAIAVVHADLRVHPDDEVTALTLVGTSDIGSSDASPGFAAPRSTTDGWPTASGEATAERSLGVDLGDSMDRVGYLFTVVGHTDGVTVTAGVPVSFVALEDAQAIGYAGAPLATAIAVTGHPGKAPADLSLLTNDAVRSDLLVPLKDAVSTIQLILDLLWLVAVMVIGSVVYLTSLDRTRDFVVLKATGATEPLAPRWPGAAGGHPQRRRRGDGGGPRPAPRARCPCRRTSSRRPTPCSSASPWASPSCRASSASGAR